MHEPAGLHTEEKLWEEWKNRTNGNPLKQLEKKFGRKRRHDEKSRETNQFNCRSET